MKARSEQQERLAGARLYGILDLSYVREGEAVAMTRKLLAGGVQVLQLRAKAFSASQLVPLARELSGICREAGVPFIINDHPDLVSETGADGVHIGQDDLSVEEVRRRAGAGVLVGKSTHSLAQALAAENEAPDYLGFGPLFATPTKPDYIPVGLTDIVEVYRRVSLPVFCIGGIKKENLPEVLAAGAERVVIVSGLLLANDPKTHTHACVSILNASGDAAATRPTR